MEFLGGKSTSFTSSPCILSSEAVIQVCFMSANAIVATGVKEDLDK